MAKNNSQSDKVVGVFFDEAFAMQAERELQSAGYNVRRADEKAISAFRDSGFADEIVEMYRGRLNEGNTILVVEGQGNGEDALGLMLNYGAEYINLSGQQTGAHMGGQQYDAGHYHKLDTQKRQYGRYDQQLGRARNQDEVRVQLRSEELTATKQARQSGEVQVHKEVVEREQQIPVNLKHEEVYVERRAVDRPASGEIGDMQDETIRVPVYEEQVQLQKQGRVAEEVTIGKRAVEENQTVSGTVREERLVVDEQGDVDMVGGDGTSGQTRGQTTGSTQGSTTTNQSQKSGNRSGGNR